ncbi:MAG TPA: alkane 1-monooxygenase [Sphingomicrobium sp.]
MAPLRYLTPFAFLALVPLGGWLGGAWTFLAAAATPLCLASLDSALGEDDARTGTASRWLPRIYILLQLAATGWAAALVARPTTTLLEAVGLTLSTGMTTGVFGFVAAHEMIHSRRRKDRALGLALLGSVLYMHFRIAHVYGHHRRAATFEDPATARLGEGLYAFLLRSIAGQFREAWAFEAKRQRHNRMIIYVALELLFLLAMALVSIRALLFVIAVAILAVTLLESFNYVAHYGLSRRMRRNGRPEPLGLRHSWNSGRRMNNAALFNMGRHSDHHRRTSRPYAQLEELLEEPKLPSGYAAALLTALLPPLWRRLMDARAERVMAAGRWTGR